jgi:uncharacterized protein (TIGR03435 family)
MRVTIAVLLLSMSVAARSQSPAAAAFDVASVKPNRSGQPMRLGPTLQPGGRVFAVNLPLEELIRAAYELRENELIIDSRFGETTFDIEARAGVSVQTDQARAMLRTLLAERFALKAHRETRELPIYSLVRVTNGRLGPQLRESGPQCAALKFPEGPGAPPPPPPPPPGAGGTPLRSRRMFAKCPTMFYHAGASARSIDMDAFAETLAGFVGRPVINKTGLSGDYDLDLIYTPDDGPPVAAAAQAPSLPTALQEQLGLKLESGRAPVEVLVVDAIQPPTEN